MADPHAPLEREWNERNANGAHRSGLDEATAVGILRSMVGGSSEPMLRGASAAWALAEIERLRDDLCAIAQAHPLNDADRLREWALAALGEVT